MANAGDEGGGRPPISLSSISILESSTQWIKWNREVKDYITVTGYGDMFVRNATEPIQGTLTVELWKAKKKAWLAKHERRACAVINNRLGYNGREAVRNLSTVAEIIAKVEARFRPSGSAVFTALDREYNELSLSDCDNVMDFAEKLRKAENELLELDAYCKIGELHFIHKFLSSLVPSFDIVGITTVVRYKALSFHEVISVQFF